MRNPEAHMLGTTEQRERPKALYHATPIAGLETLEPRARSVRDSVEGPVVFATPDKAYATVFLFQNDGRWTQHGKINRIPYILIAQDREEFIQGDHGGFIYELSPDGFKSDPNKGMGGDEWTHQGEVQPLVTEKHPSALDAMLESGVQVYFVDQETLKRFQGAGEQDIEVIKGLVSENQRRGVNAQAFEEIPEHV